MAGFCRSTGHYINDADSTFCGQHGAPLLDRCTTCGGDFDIWEKETGGEYAQPFCRRCGQPASWASASDLYSWARDLLENEGLSQPELVKLQAAIRLVQGLEDPSKVAAVWDQIRRSAPKAWPRIKPFIPAMTNPRIWEIIKDFFM